MMKSQEKAEVHIVGGGLAGSEAAWQIANLGIQVIIHEMRPQKMTPAHKTSQLGELVCSNTFKSMDIQSPAGCLKEEMARLGSIIIESAQKTKIDAGTKPDHLPH